MYAWSTYSRISHLHPHRKTCWYVSSACEWRKAPDSADLTGNVVIKEICYAKRVLHLESSLLWLTKPMSCLNGVLAFERNMVSLVLFGHFYNKEHLQLHYQQPSCHAYTQMYSTNSNFQRMDTPTLMPQCVVGHSSYWTPNEYLCRPGFCHTWQYHRRKRHTKDFHLCWQCVGGHWYWGSPNRALSWEYLWQGFHKTFSAALSHEYWTKLMDFFNVGEVWVLIYTDAARMVYNRLISQMMWLLILLQGCNIPDINMVIQWKLPDSVSTFVPWAGRTTCADGNKGLVILLAKKSAYTVDVEAELKSKQNLVSFKGDKKQTKGKQSNEDSQKQKATKAYVCGCPWHSSRCIYRRNGQHTHCPETSPGYNQSGWRSLHTNPDNTVQA